MPVDSLQNGRYRSQRLLGSGGMGEVYLMQDTRVSRQVAIKVTRSTEEGYPEKNTDSDAANRLFQREAKAIAALDHPNILPLYDFGEESSENTAITYMVMPYCADGSLEGWLRQYPGRTLAPQDVAYLVEQAAEGLQYAHEHQVIHLDVKPSNFLLRSNKRNPDRPLLLLADFGIARNFTTVATTSHTIRGTPTAMAPEQWASAPVFASDQYALAVMAYELLTGRPPFTGSMEQLMYQHFNVVPQPPSAYNPLLPAALDAVILRALSKKPEERFPSVTDFASELTQVVQGLSAAPAMSQGARGNDASTHATILTISHAEAEAGLSRLITIPGRSQIFVPIPPGVRHGQVIHLANPGNPSSQGEAVVLTIAIKDTRPFETPMERGSGEQARETPPSGMQAPSAAELAHNLPTVSAFDSRGLAGTERTIAVGQKSPKSRRGVVATLSIAVAILLLASTIFFYVIHQAGSPALTSTTIHHTQTPTVGVKLSPTVKVHNGLYIAGTYNGSIFDETTSQAGSISVMVVQTRGDGTLSGSFTFKSPSPGTYTLAGTDDAQGNFSFTVQQPTGQLPLYFFGTFQQAAYLHGYFCHSSANSCPTNTGTGYFTAGPRI